MFFPRDIETTSELSNNAIAPNGFYLDLAGSKYLHLSYVREVLAPGATSVTEDVRENKAAKDGDRFTKEGIYTITVTNESTGKETTKRIYVGSDEIVKAYMVTGLSISEIRDRLENGATIAADGSIIAPKTGEKSTEKTVTEEAAEEDTVSTEGGNSMENEEDVSAQEAAETNNKENINTTGEAESQEKHSAPIIPVAAGAIAVIGAVTIIGRNIKKKKTDGRSSK